MGPSEKKNGFLLNSLEGLEECNAFTWSKKSLDLLANSAPNRLDNTFWWALSSLTNGKRDLLVDETIFSCLRSESVVLAFPSNGMAAVEASCISSGVAYPSHSSSADNVPKASKTKV